MRTSSTIHSRPAVAGRDWRKTLRWLIAELLAVKLIALIVMRLAFFQTPLPAPDAQDVAAKLFPVARASHASSTLEKSHD